MPEQKVNKKMLWLLGGAAIFIVLIKVKSQDLDVTLVLALLAICTLGAGLFMPSHWVHLVTGIGMFIFFPLMGLLIGRVPSLQKWDQADRMVGVDEPGYWFMIVLWFLVSVAVICFGVHVIKTHGANASR